MGTACVDDRDRPHTERAVRACRRAEYPRDQVVETNPDGCLLFLYSSALTGHHGICLAPPPDIGLQIGRRRDRTGQRLLPVPTTCPCPQRSDAVSTPKCRLTQPTNDKPKGIAPRDLNYTAALIAANNTKLRKLPGERDTEFVKRIVCAYQNAIPEAEALLARINSNNVA